MEKKYVLLVYGINHRNDNQRKNVVNVKKKYYYRFEYFSPFSEALHQPYAYIVVQSISHGIILHNHAILPLSASGDVA